MLPCICLKNQIFVILLIFSITIIFYLQIMLTGALFAQEIVHLLLIIHLKYLP
jgi:hypothetical protein